MSLLRSSHIALREGHKAISIGWDLAAVPGIPEEAGSHGPGSAGTNWHGHGGLEMEVICRITWLGGRIHVDMDPMGSFGYFGSPDSRIIGKDFTRGQRRDLTLRKEILWQSGTASEGWCWFRGKVSGGQ